MIQYVDLIRLPNRQIVRVFCHLIRENESRLDSENLLQCNRFLPHQAYILKDAAVMSIKIHRIGC